MSSNSTLAEPLRVPEQRHIVTFRLDKHTYGLPIECIVQIIEMVTITPLPQMHDLLEGLITVKGRPVPVLSLRRCLGLPRIDWHLHTPIILVRWREMICGLVVDAVIDVAAFPGERVVPPKDVFPNGQGDVPCIAGVIRTPDNMILLLDLEEMIHTKDRDFSKRLAKMTSSTTAKSRRGSTGRSKAEGRT